MFGLLFLLLFLSLGFASSNRIFSSDSIIIRFWAGGVIGLVALMCTPVIFSIFIGFNIISNLLGLLLTVALYLLVRRFFKEEGSFQFKPGLYDYIFLSILTIITSIVVIILNGHILSPKLDGGLYGGQSTYGDLSLHLGIITSIATQGKFPPDYSIFPGTLLSYPFFFDSLSSSLYLFGTPLRWAVLLPSYVSVVLIVTGIFVFTYEILKNKLAASFTTLLFFFNGGFGFIYFIDGLMKDPSNFNRIFTAWYNTPTNYNEHFIRWSNTICDMIVPQRTSLGGWMVAVFALWLMQRALSLDSKRYFLLAGITAGTLPMIHTHSFLAFGIITLVWFFVYYLNPLKKVSTNTKSSNSSKNESYVLKWLLFSIMLLISVTPFIFSNIQKLVAAFSILALFTYTIFYSFTRYSFSEILNYIKKWIYFGIPVMILALPQLIFWTFRQASGSGFNNLQAGWASNQGDIWIWFWIKNIGPVFILLFSAILASKKRMLNIISGSVILFAVSNLILFQPNDYDNNKLLYIWYIFSSIAVTALLFSIYKRMEGMYGRVSLLAIFLAISMFSGVLTIGREITSNDQFMLYDKNAVDAAEFIKASTPSDALFISSDQHLNPVSSLAGRNIFSGTGLYLYFHGINKTDRDQQIRTMFTDVNSFSKLSSKNKIDYVFYSNYERSKFNVEPDYFVKNYPTVFHQGDIYIFAISDRAKQNK